MKVLLKKTGYPPQITNIPNKLEALQKLVGGYIETVPVDVDGVVLVCNEEGKLCGMRPNFSVGWDIIFGDAFFVGINNDDFTSITDKQMKEVASKYL